MRRIGNPYLRVGIVGAGLMGDWHAARFARLPVKVLGFYDVSPERAAKVVAERGGRAFDSLDALLDAVDVVDVCTPTPHHREPVLAAAAAGKDIICEKPLARRLRDVEEMVAVCEAAGVRLFVAQVVRFFRQFSRAKARLDDGALGSPGVIGPLRGGGPPNPATRPWFGDFAQSGGVIMDVSIHDLDFCRWCFGDVERLFARGLTFARVEPYDHALILLRFKSGAIGHIEGSWAFPPGNFRTRLEIAGDGGLLEVDSLNRPPIQVTLKQEGAELAAGVPLPGSPMHPTDDPYYCEIAHFFDCLGSGEEFRVASRDGL